MTEKRRVKTLPIEADHNMIEAAYMLIETMPKGTPERLKRIAAEVWRTMAEYAPPPKPGGLTRLQQRCHEAIADHINDYGQSPTYEEIGAILGKGKSQVFSVVHALRKRGVINFGDHRLRSITLLVRPGDPVPPKIRKGQRT